MKAVCVILSSLASDEILFPALQAILVLFVLYVVVRDWTGRTQARGKPGASATVTRGEKPMAIFYGLYAAATGLLVAISLSVETAAGYRVFWALTDTLLVAYVCLRNAWFRNHLIGLANRLKELEDW